jgi:phosphoribosylformylglycinamidine synthase subunit PurS
MSAMKYAAKVEVSLKAGHSNPEGETTANLLKELGYSVSAVDVSKAYTIFLEAKNPADAQAKAEEMSRRLLANPTKDNFTITVEEQK